MLNHWMFKAWRHNRTYTKLVPIFKLKEKPYWIYLMLSTLALAAAAYSSQGFVHDIFPNLSFIKQDRQRLLLKRRAFDTLVMSHQSQTPVSKCLKKSLF